MPAYPITWITNSISLGHAPMSYEELDSIKAQGIDAIVNLCAEFSDLHEIEMAAGFEVYYLPIWDEDVPEMDAMEKALAWLDEAVYLGKKILIHCRHGIGRTGTFITSYMIRRGMDLKAAKKNLKSSRATPTNYGQWKLLKRYTKQSGVLKIREPSLERDHRVDLSHFFSEYESLVHGIDTVLGTRAGIDGAENGKKPCGKGDHEGCRRSFKMQIMEVIYINSRINRQFASRQRDIFIARSINASKEKNPGCPLNNGSGCAIFEFRPIGCRLYDNHDKTLDHPGIHALVSELSRTVFLALSGQFLPPNTLSFSVADTISGKFVQAYFHHMMALERAKSYST
ncbi:putative protein phosphatase [Desulforapulum autotrophicum HRM2]|uniref:Uncharacterized protein n=1 Tax=Desulforapulum autotrophicum (strain ATCC 43914 / DSM 3382 / VKM B-1955 / HRM2) TaxID=177437 RepID=C0QAE9_DESAH|nr:dual specificity protein phosphatase family protein [Desulforapulum autotrophicum]ACN14734.1 putative protein phosphatase [Desulforapulum autotrophicum HRM2]